MAEKSQIHVVGRPEQVGVEDLLVGDSAHGHDRENQKEDPQRSALIARERLSRGRLCAGAPGLGGKPFAPGAVHGKRNQHTDAGGAESVVPSVGLAESPRDERRDDHRAVDEQQIDLEGIGAPQVIRRIQAADLAGDVAFEESDTDQQARERDQEGHIECHQEMTGGHQHRPDRDGARLPEPAIGKDASGDGCQVDESRVQAKDGGRESDDGQGAPAAVEPLQKGAQRGESRDLLDVAGVQQLAHHVEHQQRLHAVVGEALPAFREGQISQPSGMAHERVVRSG